MMKHIIFLSYILISTSVYSQETEYFKTKRDYKYKALYIDSIGDTITNEVLTIRIPNRRWIGQPWLQKSVIYIYDTDTADYRNYVDPSSVFQELSNEYFIKHGEFRLREKETTGGLESKRYSYLYMHPPRANQYRMLFHAAHPYFFYSALEKEIDTVIITNQQYYGAGYMHQVYIYQDLGKRQLLGDSINVYQVGVTSNLVTKKEDLLNKIDFYSSTLNALFSMEYGFIKMHYEFKSGVRIEFDLIEVVDNI